MVCQQAAKQRTAATAAAAKQPSHPSLTHLPFPLPTYTLPGKLELQEILYVLDEFCGEVCFECRCPSVHQKKMTTLSGAISVIETISQTAVVIPLFIFAFLIGLCVLYMDAIIPCYHCR